MFTGIIKLTGRLQGAKINAQKGVSSLAIKAPKLHAMVGASIAVNGVCLTVTKKVKDRFSCDVVAETLRRTNLGTLKPGARLNIEPSLRLGDSLDGHFVSGHVDATARLIKKSSNNELTFELPRALAKFIAHKGSVTLNGVSLTVSALTTSSFSIALISFTAQHTNLGALKIGDGVNLEVDLLARYLYNFFQHK